MNPSVSNALEGLRDIHLPAPVPFWPPAPGWFAIVFLAIVVGVVVVVAMRIRKRRDERWNAAASRELDALEAEFTASGDPTVLAANLSQLMRRTALARYPDRGVAALHGDAWFDLLRGNPALDSVRDPRVAEQFTRAAYRGRLEGDEDPDAWLAFAHSWIEEAA